MHFKIVYLIIIALLLSSCVQSNTNSRLSSNEGNKPTVKAASLRPIVETKNIDGLTVVRYSMDEKKRFAISISPTTKSETSRHMKIAKIVLDDVCAAFGPPLDKNNVEIGQVSKTIGTNGYLSPAYDEGKKTAYLYLWCNVIRQII